MDLIKAFHSHFIGYYTYDEVEAIPGILHTHIVDEPEEVRKARADRNAETIRKELCKPNPLFNKLKKTDHWKGGRIEIPFYEEKDNSN